MPFTEAFIMEVQRLASVLPICPPRLVTSEFNVCGYTLKKGVQVQMNLYALHRNEAHWGPDVMAFRPERFWDTDGRVKPDEWLQPFGYGNCKKIYGCKDRKLFFAFFPFTPLLITKLQTIILDPIFQCNFQRKLLALHPRLDI